ncbi:MAG: hypothetical protein N2440_05475 [Actinobacteria bacterium]|nr:hypothetical protein [Actinomycetota bacterium]
MQGNEPKNDEIKVEMTVEACKDTLKKIISDIEFVQLTGSDSVKVTKSDDNFEAEIYLKLKKWLSIPEVSEQIQKRIYEEFLLNTGFQLQKIDITFESFFED